MANFDAQAVRDAIASEIGDDEVLALTATYQASGKNGTVTVQVWHDMSSDRYMVSSYGTDENGEAEEAHGNPESDPVLAVQVGHLGQWRR